MAHIMRKAVLGAFLAVAVMAAGVSDARAQAKMALIDVQAAMAQSKAGQSIQKQVVTERKALEAEMKKLEKGLLDEQKVLSEGREKMAPEEYMKKQAALNNKATEASRGLQMRDAGIKQSAIAAMGELEKVLVDVTSAMAKEGKFDLLISRQAVVAAPAVPDVTDDVIKALDKKVTDMKLKPVAQAKPAPAAAKPAGKS